MRVCSDVILQRWRAMDISGHFTVATTVGAENNLNVQRLRGG